MKKCSSIYDIEFPSAPGQFVSGTELELREKIGAH